MPGREIEVVVIGAGPAGLSAAAAAREAGASVRLLDSSDATGGQYWRHLPESRPAEDERALHHDWDDYLRLREVLESDPGVRIDLGAHVWAIEQTDDGVRVDILHGPPDGTHRTSERLLPERLVLATGAHDRALPVPGWTLPGVFTAGAAQALAKGERVAIGRRVVVAGTGPFLLPASTSLSQVGADVVCVIEAASGRHLARSWARRPWELTGVGAKVGELARYGWHHLRHRVPFRTGRAVVEIHGEHRVEAVTIARLDAAWRPVPGTEERIACDAVSLGHGFVPRLELAIAAGCRLGPDRFVTVDESQATSVEHVHAAGELTGIGGADLARAEGRIAGWVAGGGSLDAAAIARARRRRDTYRAFARRLDQATAIGADWADWLTPSTIVCRCEEVDLALLEQVADATAPTSLRSLKLTTRAGLGACQGRICGRNVECLVKDRLAEVPEGSPGTDRRPVAIPVRLGELAALRDLPASTPPKGHRS